MLKVHHLACAPLLHIIAAITLLSGCGSAPVAAPESAVNAPTQPAKAPEPAGSGSGSGQGEGSAAAVASAPVPAIPQFNATGSAEPLNEATRAIVWGTPEDVVPKKLNATRADLEDRHYLYCDELHLAKFYPTVKDIHGTYLGVGSDQAYTFIGWMDADLAWLTDYDDWIRELHRAYAAFFEAAQTPEEFVNLWKPSNKKTSRELLKTKYADDPNKDLLLRVYDNSVYVVSMRLGRIRTMARDYKIPTFASDDAMYTKVRSKVLGGRIRPLRANLIDTTAIRAIGAATKEVNAPVRLIYLSNAEEYWPYPQAFRDNIASLPFDQNSWIARTASAKRTNGDYRYNLHRALDFQRKLLDPKVRGRNSVWSPPYAKGPDDIPLIIIDPQPADGSGKAP